MNDLGQSAGRSVVAADRRHLRSEQVESNGLYVRFSKGPSVPGPFLFSRMNGAINSPFRPFHRRPAPMAGLSFFGSSATIASVVIKRPAIEEASCSAMRTTLVGSMMPFDTRLPNSPVCAS